MSYKWLKGLILWIPTVAIGLWACSRLSWTSWRGRRRIQTSGKRQTRSEGRYAIEQGLVEP